MPVQSIKERFTPIRDKLAAGDSLRVVFVNDCGFIAGAGMAQKRQAAAMLARGHEVAVVCGLDNEPTTITTRDGTLPSKFLGFTCLPEHNGREGPIKNPAQISKRVVSAVNDLKPDLVIAGNLHWTGWPVTLPTDLTNAGIPTVCYLHDCYYFTGRCVHPGSCTTFEQGCDQSCPTPTEYPALNPLHIADAHNSRKAQFVGPNSVPIAGNSEWTIDIAQRGLGDGAHVPLIPLGVDEHLFSPIDQKIARRMLDLPLSPKIMLFGATDVGSEIKGGPFMHKVCEMLSSRDELMMCAFGYNSNFLRGVHGFGHINDERMMPLLYAASDFYVSFSKEETFGQTSMEAAACERAIICRKSGGIVDIARNGINARVIHPDSEEDFAQTCIELALDPKLCSTFGKAGRQIVLNNYTLGVSGSSIERWVKSLATNPHIPNSPNTLP
ncbi:MAG: glycosyltransferase [Phycisphaerales bacterium]